MSSPRLRSCLPLALALLGLVLAAPASPARAAALDPCSLITPAEAQAALGQPARAPESKDTKNPLGQAICFYGAASETSMNFVQISLVTTQGMAANMRKNGYSAAKLYKDSKALLDNPQPVTGFGQEAFYGGSGLKAGAGLHVLKGDYYLTFMVGPGGDPLARCKQMAEKALPRLP